MLNEVHREIRTDIQRAFRNVDPDIQRALEKQKIFLCHRIPVSYRRATSATTTTTISTADMVATAGTAATSVKDEISRSSWRPTLSQNDCVLKTIKGILKKLTPEKFDILKDHQLIASGITSVNMLKGVISLIFDQAVLEPAFCPMYVQLFSNLNKKLPPFPSDEPGDRELTVKRVLLNNCQLVFECAENLRKELRQMNAPGQEIECRDKDRLLKLQTLRNIRLIGELFKQKMVPEKIIHHIVQELLGFDPKSCQAEENVEAICQFMSTIGKQLDENVYFLHLKDLATNPQLAPRLRFMICDILDMLDSKAGRGDTLRSIKAFQHQQLDIQFVSFARR